MRRLLAILLLALTGCAGTPWRPLPPGAELFADASFAPPREHVGSEDVFALTPEMRKHVRSPPFQDLLRARTRAQGLVNALYSDKQLKLEYESSFTRTAAETFRDRAGNCMSLVIMTAAFANELGIDVQFQSVDMETWSRSGSLYMLSGHVNIVLGSHRPNSFGSGDDGHTLLVDFVPDARLDPLHTHALSRYEIVTMFLNNRAAEALVAGRIDDAYWWARAAVMRNPHGAMAFNTLGVIYERHGNPDMAERAYRAALAREPENLGAMKNLQPVLAALGKTAEAQAIAERLAVLEPTPPFYYFNQGVLAYQAGDFAKARDLFARELQRAPYNDEFHFWLAASYLQLGDRNKAGAELARAADTSTQDETRKRYAAKLSHLRQMGMR